MSYEDALFEAVRAVLDLDTPEEDCPEAVQSRAALFAKQDADEERGN